MTGKETPQPQRKMATRSSNSSPIKPEEEKMASPTKPNKNETTKASRSPKSSKITTPDNDDRKRPAAKEKYSELKKKAKLPDKKEIQHIPKTDFNFRPEPDYEWLIDEGDTTEIMYEIIPRK